MLKRMRAPFLTLTTLGVLAFSWNASPATKVEAKARPAAPAHASGLDQSESRPALGPEAQAEVDRQRAEIVAFVTAAYHGPSDEQDGRLAAIQPEDEAMHALGGMTDDDVRRIYKAVPLIGQHQEIEAGLSALAAQTSAPGGLAAASAESAQADDPESVRQGLNQVLDMQATWAGWVVGTPPDFAATIEDNRRLLANATSEDLLALQRALSFIPNWRTALAPDLNALLGGTQAMANVQAGKRSSPDGLLVTDEQCSDADYSRDTVPLIIAAAALAGSARIAGFAADLLPEDIKACVGIFGAVICADFPNPFYQILKLAEFVITRAADGINAAILVANTCQNIKHWKLFIMHRDEFLIDAQTVLTELMTRNNEIVERADRIDFTNREAWKLRLQLSIEENLLLPDPKPDGSDENRISLFQLTDTVCFNPDELLPTPVFALPTPDVPTPAPTIDPAPVLAPIPTARSPFIVPDRREQCGLLLVKRIVEESILMNKMAGNDVHNADDTYAAAMVHLNAGRYKLAYLRFREAYRDAVQPDAEPRQAMSTMPEITAR
ncbi:MAG: hypothetical protein IPJ58_06730 [Ardenticatenia bacterium]|nr:hypothetical protein [Ardenticatenia bacterium]